MWLKVLQQWCAWEAEWWIPEHEEIPWGLICSMYSQLFSNCNKTFPTSSTISVFIFSWFTSDHLPAPCTCSWCVDEQDDVRTTCTKEMWTCESTICLFSHVLHVHIQQVKKCTKHLNDTEPLLFHIKKRSLYESNLSDMFLCKPSDIYPL